MGIDLGDEIVRDFLVEAGEILETLGGQLVELESRPDDSELLNAIFRGFHTIKGGASFLGLEHLVAVSHMAEDVFDLLRRGERGVDAALMDVVLQVTDTLQAMFAQLRAGEPPAPADDALLARLATLAGHDADAGAGASGDAGAGDAAEAAIGELLADLGPCAPPAAAAPEAAPLQAPPTHGAASVPAGDGGGEITEAEFEALLDALHGPGKAPAAPAAAAAGEEITEAEFEALLDALHAPGRVQGHPLPLAPSSREAAPPPPVAEAEPAPARSPAEQPAGAEQAARSAAESTIRVETAVLDRIMNMVGELVLIRNRLVNLEAEIGNEQMTKTVGALDLVTSDLQAAAMQTRMQPVKKVFGRFPRVVRDLARSLDKEVKLELAGEDTDLDKNLVEALADPLVHLVRNAVDHGIEAPQVRERAGKPRCGTLRLAAEQEGDHILLTVSDDGAGMDADALRRKAVEKGLMDEDSAARLSDRECFELIFMPGFSTKGEVSDISGRGVGMDVVKTRINQLNGTIEVDSRPGAGTRIYVRLPLTLAIMPTLMVTLGEQIFALPLVNVKEIIDYEVDRARTVEGQRTMVVRGRAVPLFYLGRWLVRGAGEYGRRHGHVVIVNVGMQAVGLLVDQLLGREEVVIKPLGALLAGTKGLAGATITGDGRIALILDLPDLIAAYARR